MKVTARITSGFEIYPHRSDLSNLPFWICDTCKNYVGCHKTSNRLQPLGFIPTKELRTARIYIHAILDPIWKQKRMARTKLYKLISDKVGYKFHTANIKTIEEARKAYLIIKEIASS